MNSIAMYLGFCGLPIVLAMMRGKMLHSVGYSTLQMFEILYIIFFQKQNKVQKQQQRKQRK